MILRRFVAIAEIPKGFKSKGFKPLQENQFETAIAYRK
jgi:hypothetical protein